MSVTVRLSMISDCFLLKSYHNLLDATYLLKAIQGFQNQGFPVYAISIQVRKSTVSSFSSKLTIRCTQNEPQNSNPTYPTCIMTPDVEGQIGSDLQSLLKSSSLSGVKIVGYEVNSCFLIPRNLSTSIHPLCSIIGIMPGVTQSNWQVPSILTP